MDLQSFFDQQSEIWKSERADSQMTIGKLLSSLQDYPKDKTIANLNGPHSYRGYYSDLSFELTKGQTTTVGSLIDLIKDKCLDKTFEGYKGGDFYMGFNTPVWIAQYGCSGVKIVGIQEGDTLTFITEEDYY